MVAQDGSQHRPEMLLAEALDGVARSAANGAPVSEVAVTVPAHWRAPMVDALRAAMRSKPGLSSVAAGLRCRRRVDGTAVESRAARRRA